MLIISRALRLAERVIEVQLAIFECLMRRDGNPMSVEDLAMETLSVDDTETVYKICEHLAANGRLEKIDGEWRFDALYGLPRGEENEFPIS